MWKRSRILTVFTLVAGFLAVPKRNVKGVGLLTVMQTKENTRVSM